MSKEDITSIILESLLNKVPKTMKNEVSSRLINKHHDQWCRDHGYPIKARVVKRGPKSGRNVAKKRHTITT